jgi:hypothetical protein
MCIDSLGCDHASIRTASPSDVIKPTLAFESRVLRSAEARQRCELIESEGILTVEFCKPVMFADRIRQGHKVLSCHAPYTVEHISFNYVQLADDEDLVRARKEEPKWGDRSPPTPFFQGEAY